GGSCWSSKARRPKRQTSLPRCIGQAVLSPGPLSRYCWFSQSPRSARHSKPGQASSTHASRRLAVCPMTGRRSFAPTVSKVFCSFCTLHIHLVCLSLHYSGCCLLSFVRAC